MDVQAAVGEGCAEHEVAERQLDELLMRGFNVKTVGADKGYHNRRFVRACRDREIAPHVARIEGRQTPGLDGRTTRAQGYRLSQRIRKRCENIFGWMKTTGALRQSRWRGGARTAFMTNLVAATCNLARMARLMEESPPRYKAAVV